MRFSAWSSLALLVSSLVSTSAQAWYRSPQDLWGFCKSVSFENPLCPQITSLFEVYQSPRGPLTDQNLLLAATALRLDRPAIDWLESLQLTDPKPSDLSTELWQNARWVYAQALYIQKKYSESLKVFDELNETFKRRAIFHQQRAWVQYFSGQWSQALGSIVSAESPLVDRVPFIRKYLLRALIERESCLYEKALQTVRAGRQELQALKINPQDYVFVRVCDSKVEGQLCTRVSDWYVKQAQEEVRRALHDLDYLEAELTEKGLVRGSTAAETNKPVVWPFVGEAWLDELGRYTVDLTSACGDAGSVH